LNKFIDMFRFIALPFDKRFHILILIYEKKIIYKVILIDKIEDNCK